MMQRYAARVSGLLLGLGLILVVTPVQAVITSPLPLSRELSVADYVFVARVDSLDPDKPGMVLTVDEDLKAKAPFRRLPVNLKGDDEAVKENQSAQLLKRLAPNLSVVVFVNQARKNYVAFVYTNGTWFQLLGRKAEDSDAVRWQFIHCEPYLRRTYKENTADLAQVIRDALAGTKKPPEVDTSAEPGLGPEIKSDKAPAKEPGQAWAGNGPVFAVIPTVLVGGPLAILALLFPAVFGGLALFFRRWVVVLSILSIDSTLYALYDYAEPWIKDYWWGTPLALWIAMLLASVAGLLWAWGRHLTAVQEDAALASEAAALLPEEEPLSTEGDQSDEPEPALPSNFSPTVPQRIEHLVLWGVSLLGVGLIAFCLWQRDPLLDNSWRKPVFLMWLGIWAGTLYAFYLRWHTRQGGSCLTALPVEGVMLGVMVLAGAGLGLTTLPRAAAAGGEVTTSGTSSGETGSTAGAQPVGVVWKFEPKEGGAFDSSPRVVGDRVYIAAAHTSGFQTFGVLYCLDRKTGKEMWSFDNDGEMKQVFSTPCVADGRLFIGEGFHQDKNCKLFCLDAATGQKVWEFKTSSHTESSPCVADGKVYFGAGDDGVYCVNAATGKEVWHFPGLHVDCNPAVVGKRLYAGSGVGDLHRETLIFCLDSETGRLVWRVPTELPVWGSPTVAGGRVFYGLGNGNFVQSGEKPAGAVWCGEAESGEQVWQANVPDAVLDRPAVDRHAVYFGSRDHFCYCVDRLNGHLRWKQNLGSPVVTAPLLARGSGCTATSIFAIGSEGRVYCLDPEDGHVDWLFDVGKDAQKRPEMFSTPAVVLDVRDDGVHRTLFFGTGLDNFVSKAAVLYCYEDRYPDD